MSSATAYIFIALTVILTAYGQLAIKWKIASSPPISVGLGERLVYVLQLFCSPLIISALAAAVAASVCWMLAVSKLPLSHAYPMMASTFVIIAVGGYIAFGENLSFLKILGLALIIVGIAIGSRG